MRTTHGDKYLPGAGARRSAKLRAVVRNLRQALLEIRDSVRSGDRRQRTFGRRRDRGAPGVSLTQIAHGRGEPEPPGLSTSSSDTEEHRLVPPPDKVSRALTVLREQLLHELGDAEVEAAEIRVIVQKQGHRSYRRLDPGSKPGPVAGELALELRRLIAWSGGTIADVAEALDTHGSDLDRATRELLQDEVAALEIDVAMLNVHLADPVDWDSEFERLLGGEIAPCDEPASDEDDEKHD